MKLTKIVCTIGPASESVAMLVKMIRSGMNVCRLNFSHGTHASHARLIANIRKAAKACKEEVAILQDLQGPRIRIGEVANAGVQVSKGERVVLVPQEMYKGKSEPMQLPNHYPKLSADVKPGHHILISDGLIDLKVVKVSGPEIHCVVIAPGVVKSHKGMNIPGASLSVSSLSKKDKEDILFGISHGVDFIGMSFVRSRKDVVALKTIIKRHAKKYPNANRIGVIAKIERAEAVENINEILTVVDGVMVARGDLGIEVPPQKVPVIQKELIAKCLRAGKPVIVATQMMESMIYSRRPTRAEVSDVANAVIDHTDAVMLSGESATGLYPLETVQMMSQTIHETERSRYDDYTCEHAKKEQTVFGMLSHAACSINQSGKIKCIVAESDEALVRLLALHRPDARIIAFSGKPETRRQLSLVHGVTVFSPQKNSHAFLKKMKLAKKGDLILCVENDELELETV